MTETEFMEIVREVRGIDDPSFLDIPLEAAPFDSLDLLELRALLETRLDLPLTDERFNSASRLRDLYILVNSVSK
jgi:acyl carrier protein